MNTLNYTAASRALRPQRWLAIALLLVLAGCDSDSGESIKKVAQLKTAEVVGNIAARNLQHDVAGGFHNIPIELRVISDNIYQATGISNAHLITTSEGSVLFDAGISIQSAKQIKLMKEHVKPPLTHIILSHSHADHIGGTRFWQEKDTQIVAHREFVEEQRYLKELEPYLWNRNRTVFPWMPEEFPTNNIFAYGGIEPDIEVDHRDYEFTLGEETFVVLDTPGAEGADNISLWLPSQEILFSGDFFGPLWPQFPNIFTMRGEKVRKPIEYIESLDKLIALEPAMIVPSHHTPVTGKDNIRNGMIRMRDAVQYVHDEVIAGMNAGKTVHDLMKEVKLPESLSLTEEHGKVSWAVKSIWEYYATWFHFDSTTELYPVPARDVYADIAEIADGELLLSIARNYLNTGEPIKALHLVEVGLAGNEADRPLRTLQLDIFEHLLEAADVPNGNNYEKDYLRAMIASTKKMLDKI